MMNHNTLSPIEAGICLLAIEREKATSEILMKGEPWCNADPKIVLDLEHKLDEMRRG